MTNRHYSRVFFETLIDASLDSVSKVSRLAFDAIGPTSVIDFGCAEGHWLRAFQELGVTDIYGLDGTHVDQARLVISKDHFAEVDLERIGPVSRRYSLALCLEVAEHLSVAGGDRLIEAICQSADAAMFSAAVPRQGGTNHINEQWIDYWVCRFQRLGWKTFDYFRPRIAYDREVAWWYRQNLFMALSPTRSELISKLTEQRVPDVAQEWVHFETFGQHSRLSSILKQVPQAFAGSLRTRLRRVLAKRW